MKKYLIAIAMVLSLSMNADAAAQKHRHTPRTEQVDSTKNKKEAIEAYSDTTNAEAEDAEDDQYITYRQGTTYSSSDARELKEVMDVVGGGMIPSMITGVVVITIIFLLAPLVIIITIFYFVNKNRRERYKLAQMAMQNGQPIPDELLKEQTRSMESSDYQSGVRQMFTGVGLAIFLGIIIGKIGIGIGALVFFIGLGKWFIARQDRQDRNDFMNRQNYNSSNQSNIQDYE
ncbi:MAG: DUF6249 domain-containing protein [Prevotella sp.]|nr:DUF6249 domain-containing protein [Prevotella sp.]